MILIPNALGTRMLSPYEARGDMVKMVVACEEKSIVGHSCNVPTDPHISGPRRRSPSLTGELQRECCDVNDEDYRELP